MPRRSSRTGVRPDSAAISVKAPSSVVLPTPPRPCTHRTLKGSSGSARAPRNSSSSARRPTKRRRLAPRSRSATVAGGSSPTCARTSLIASPGHSLNASRTPQPLDVCRYRNIMASMARAATTSDVFNAIAEQQRRQILVLLRAGEGPVTELAHELGMTQPGASKHLRVLREVGLVRDRKAGKQRLYSLDARGLRPVHEWTGGFEGFFNESFDRLEEYVQDLKQARQEE